MVLMAVRGSLSMAASMSQGAFEAGAGVEVKSAAVPH